MSLCFYCPVKGDSGYYTMVYGPEVEVPVGYYRSGQLRNYSAGFADGNNCYHAKSEVSGFISPENVVDTSETADWDKLGARYWKTDMNGVPVWVTGLSPTYSLRYGNESWQKQWWYQGLTNGSVTVSRSQQGFYTYWDLWMWDVDWSTKTAKVWRSVEVTNPKYYSTMSEAWANPGPLRWQIYNERQDIRRYIVETRRPTCATDAQTVAISESYHMLMYLEQNVFDILAQMTSYGDLCQEAAEKTQPNTTNAVSLVLDLIKLPKDLRKAGDLVSDTAHVLKELFSGSSSTKRNIHKLARDAADAILSTEYGPRLTYQDLGTMSNNILGNIPPKSKTSHQLDESAYIKGCKYSGFQRVQFNWTFSGLNALAENLRRRNIKFDLSDAWDLIPYSFVVDWFLGVGDALEKFEANKRMSKLDVSNIWHTFKLSGTRTLDLEGSRFAINNTLYCRRNLPRLLPGGISPTSQPVAHQHIVEASALLVQRT